MTIQRPDTHDPVRSRAGRADAGSVRVSARDIELLRTVGEQYAVTLPQLARLMGCSEHAARWLRSRWQRAGWAKGRALLVGEPVFVWLTRRGTSLAGIDYAVWRPNPGMLAHVAAVTDVRLHVLDGHPSAEWVCERELHRELAATGGRQRHRPDGLVVIDGREVAVEVELTLKRRARIEQIMTELVARYGSVTYFAAPAPRRALTASKSFHSQRRPHENRCTHVPTVRAQPDSVPRLPRNRYGPVHQRAGRHRRHRALARRARGPSGVRAALAARARLDLHGLGRDRPGVAPRGATRLHRRRPRPLATRTRGGMAAHLEMVVVRRAARLRARTGDRTAAAPQRRRAARARRTPRRTRPHQGRAQSPQGARDRRTTQEGRPDVRPRPTRRDRPRPAAPRRPRPHAAVAAEAHIGGDGRARLGEDGHPQRLAYGVATTTDWQVIVIDAKGDPATQRQFASSMRLAGRDVHLFPQEGYDAWRGSGREITNRLVALIDWADEGGGAYYRDLATNLVRLACTAPDGPPRSSRELLGRLDKIGLLVLWAGRPEAQEIERMRDEHIDACRQRYRSFFDATNGQLDGHWAFEDVDCAYVLLNKLLYAEETGKLGRFLVEDFKQYLAGRNPDGRQVLLIIDEFSAIADGERTARMVEVVRSYGAAVVLAPQSIDGMGGPEAANRILNAAHTILLQAIPDPEPIIRSAGTKMATEWSVQHERGLSTDVGSTRSQHQWRVDPSEVRRLSPGMCITIGNGRGEQLVVAAPPRAGDPPEPEHIFEEPEWIEDDADEPEDPVRL